MYTPKGKLQENLQFQVAEHSLTQAMRELFQVAPATIDTPQHGHLDSALVCIIEAREIVRRLSRLGGTVDFRQQLRGPMNAAATLEISGTAPDPTPTSSPRRRPRKRARAARKAKKDTRESFRRGEVAVAVGQTKGKLE